MRFSPVIAFGGSASIWTLCNAQYHDIPKELNQLKQCQSRAAFCTNILSSQIPTTTVTATLQIAPKTHTYVERTYSTSFTSTVTHTAATATLTKGISTTTISHCKIDATCDAVTFSNRDKLVAACSELVGSTSTVTRTMHTSLAEAFKLVTKFIKTETTTRMTPTTTKTVSVATADHCVTAPPPQDQCMNAGTRWAYYHIHAADKNGHPKLAHFEPALFKTRKPAYQSTTLEMGNLEGDYHGRLILYNDTLVPARNIFLNQVGYLYTPQTGSYRIRIPSVWNVAWFWIGDVAYSGWDASNAFLRVANAPPYPHQTLGAYESNEGGGNRSIHLTSGSFVPFRIAYGVGSQEYDPQADAWFYMEIRQPDGTFIEGTNAYNDYFPVDDYSHYDETFMRESPYVVQFSCDGTTAKPFPPFGHET